MEDVKHCPDHTDQAVCLKGLKAQMESVKKDGHSKLSEVGKEVHTMWATLNKKLDATTFKWFMGLLVGVMALVVAGLYGSLEEIKTGLHEIQVSQAVVTKELELTDKVEKLLNGDKDWKR